MSSEHELKAWPEPFDAVWTGAKAFEIRKDDRGFSVGDTLRLREWLPRNARYTGREISADVTWLARGPDWGIPNGMVVMSIRPISRSRGSES